MKFEAHSPHVSNDVQKQFSDPLEVEQERCLWFVDEFRDAVQLLLLTRPLQPDAELIMRCVRKSNLDGM